MFEAPLRPQIEALLEGLPARLKWAAHWMLKHPDDVALLSMREQARRAGVAPVTMTRLAQRLGFPGYDDIRALYSEHLRHVAVVTAPSPEVTAVAPGRIPGEMDSIRKFANDTNLLVESFLTPSILSQLERVSAVLCGSQKLYVLGQKWDYSAALHFTQMISAAGRGAFLLDGPGGTGIDAFRGLKKSDALLVISTKPFISGVNRIAKHAASHGCAVVTITDCEASPLNQISQAALILQSANRSLLRLGSPAFLAAEAVAILMTARQGRTRRSSRATTVLSSPKGAHSSTMHDSNGQHWLRLWQADS